MQPIDYSIDVGNPFASAVRGMQTGWAIQDREAQQQQLAAQQQQLVMQQQKQQELNTDLHSLYTNPKPTGMDYVRLITKYPELAEKLKIPLNAVSEEQKQQKISFALQVTSALNAGQPEIAKQLLEERETALRNSGQEEEAKTTAINRQMIELDPKFSKETGILMLAGVMGPEQFSKVYETMLTAPGAAQKIATETANLPTKLALDNQNAFEDIETKKLARQVSVLDAQIKSADSQIKRDELGLKRDELVTKIDESKESRALEKQDKLDTVTTGLSAVKAVVDSPLLKDTFLARRTGVGSVYRKVSQFFPGSDATDFNALLEPLKNQQFLIQMKDLRNAKGSTGLGALTEAEGKRLEQAIASLNPDQSPEAFKSAIQVIKNTFEKVQSKLVGSGELPTTKAAGGGTYVMTHPKYGVITESVVNSLLTQKPGMTREQAIQFLKDSGGK